MKIYDRCMYTSKVRGSCHNQNLGNEYCYYHQKVVDGLIVPESTVVTLSSLPSYSNIGD